MFFLALSRGIFVCVEIGAKYFRLAEALYYKILESVIDQEKRRLGDCDLSVRLAPPAGGPTLRHLTLIVIIYHCNTFMAELLFVIQGILEQDVFHRSLVACCLEIVIFSYRPPGEFPRVIEIFDLPPYHFYKVAHWAELCICYR